MRENPNLSRSVRVVSPLHDETVAFAVADGIGHPGVPVAAGCRRILTCAVTKWRRGHRAPRARLGRASECGSANSMTRHQTRLVPFFFSGPPPPTRRFFSAPFLGSALVPAARGAGRRLRDPRARRSSADMSGRASVTQLALPTGIKKLTNIAVVRLKKAGVRFEIACYKNTVVAWRDGFEKDLDNVLQTTKVYNNVSKGVFAKEEDLLRAFGTKDEETVSRLILDTGELQVSEKERKNVFDVIFRDAVTVLVEKCVNPSTNRPYPPGMIERALKEIHFSVDPMRSAKQQALAAIPKLRAVFPIRHAAMRFKLVVGREWFEKRKRFWNRARCSTRVSSEPRTTMTRRRDRR